MPEYMPPLREHASVAFLSDYVPRQCGIATFTHHLSESIAREGGDNLDVFVVAMNDQPEGYRYPERVRFEIRQNVTTDYRLAAEYLNIHQPTAICMQHEYGIFGGTCGSHVLGLLGRLRRPLVTTLHTVLREPDERQLIILKEVARLSMRLVVMSDVANEMLEEIYEVPPEKIVTIPHGIPDVPFTDPSFFKDGFGVEGRPLLMTFGLLSPGKGLEYAIEAMPEIVRKHPDVAYIILGATHPHVRRESGEEYRNGLMRRAEELGVRENIRFVNRFVEMSELIEYLGATDIYITPYPNEAQITSGTLSYAMGTGNVVVSTPYWHATEVLADGRGRLVPFKDSAAIAEQVIDLLDHPNERNAIRKRAYNYCRSMTWSNVAQRYLGTFREATEEWGGTGRSSMTALSPDRPEQLSELPEVDLRHLRTLTDDTGILQHALYSTPDRRHGYCTDDNARALIAAAMYWDQTHDEEVLPLLQTYLSFLSFALDERTGRFRNCMNYDRTWTDVVGSEDCHGRSLWGLGVGVALCPHESMISLATHLFKQSLRATESFASPRAWAFAIVGIHAYLRRFGGDTEVRRTREKLGERLMGHFTRNMTNEWPWCEDTITYSNAKLPHALLMTGKWTQQDDMINVGKRSLRWLMEVQFNKDGMLSIVGTNGWYKRGRPRAKFDQQPVEAQAMVEACIEAYRVTREKHWLDMARKSFNWFLGENDLRVPIYDFTTGGCRDGLHADRVNENQGAESTLAWLMSLLLMHDLQMEQTLNQLAADKASGERPVKPAIAPSGQVVATGKASDNVRPDRDDQ